MPADPNLSAAVMYSLALLQSSQASDLTGTGTGTKSAKGLKTEVSAVKSHMSFRVGSSRPRQPTRPHPATSQQPATASHPEPPVLAW
jgi:hypothetical protein